MEHRLNTLKEIIVMFQNFQVGNSFCPSCEYVLIIIPSTLDLTSCTFNQWKETTFADCNAPTFPQVHFFTSESHCERHIESESESERGEEERRGEERRGEERRGEEKRREKKRKEKRLVRHVDTRHWLRHEL